MRRQWPVLASILIVVVVLGLIYLRDSRRVPADQPATQIPAFPQLTNTDMRSVRLMDPAVPQDALVIAYRSSLQAWTLPGDDGPDLDQEQVDVLVTVLARMTFVDSMAPGEAGFASYGLANGGRFVAEFTTQNGVEHRLRVGNLTPAERSYYVRIDELDRVSIIERERIDLLMFVLRQPTFLMP